MAEEVPAEEVPAAEAPSPAEPAVSTEPLVTPLIPAPPDRGAAPPAIAPREAPIPAPVILTEEGPSPIGRLVALIVSLGLAWALAVAIATWLLVLVASR